MSRQFPPPGTPVTADEVLRCEFDVVRRGYDESEVDDFLDEVVLRLNAGRAALTERPQFRTKWRGYDPVRVDALIDRLAASPGPPAGPVPRRAAESAVVESRKRRWFGR